MITHTQTHSFFAGTHSVCLEPSALVVLCSAVVGTCDTADTHFVSVQKSVRVFYGGRKPTYIQVCADVLESCRAVC